MKVALIWFKQDLRLFDNPALHHAIQENDTVIPLYIFENAASKNHHSQLGGAQKWWLAHSLNALNTALEKLGSQLILQQGNALEIIVSLVKEMNIDCIYWNSIYEDQQIQKILQARGLSVKTFHASLLTQPENIHNKSGGYFKVFTPYWRYCLTQIPSKKIYPSPKKIHTQIPQKFQHTSKNLLSSLTKKLPKWSHKFNSYWQPGELGAQKKWENFIETQLNDYAKLRDFPSVHVASGLSAHLHFGEISIYQLFHEANQCLSSSHINFHSIERFINEIGWREFCHYLLHHFPELPRKNFNAKFDHFTWERHAGFLKKWQSGQTGYPIVDAGMRELWETGIMHNRVRMIVASFLIKDLLIDWREGEKWFWDTLVDADLANNTANWQWVAGSGADAAPYFRIFNPILQGQKFDGEGLYVKRWVPELKNIPKKYIHSPWLAPAAILKEAKVILGKTYPFPLIDHAKAREKALKMYKKLK